jgi:hypothetical protein
MKMFKITAALTATLFMLISQPALAAARLAVLHLAPFADTLDGTAVNIAVNGTVLFENVKFKDFVDYTELDAGEYTIDIIPVGATDPALSETVTLQDGVDYSAYAVGNAITQDLALVAIEDNMNVPADSDNVAVRVIHTAPFAADLADTEVSIRTAGGDVVNGLVGVPYLGNSGFFDIPAGTYDLKVASNDGSVNLIDPLPAALPAGAGVTLYAIGDGINQPLSIIAFPVGELPLRTPVDNRSNGMWEIIEGSGTGFVFQPMPSQNRVVGTWYTYDELGVPTFLTFDSCLNESSDDEGFVCSMPGGFDGMTATTALYLSTGGGPSEDDVVLTEKIGEIDFEIMGCNDAMAVVTLTGETPVMYTARQLTRPFPCVDAQ